MRHVRTDGPHSSHLWRVTASIVGGLVAAGCASNPASTYSAPATDSVSVPSGTSPRSTSPSSSEYRERLSDELSSIASDVLLEFTSQGLPARQPREADQEVCGAQRRAERCDQAIETRDVGIYFYWDLRRKQRWLRKHSEIKVADVGPVVVLPKSPQGASVLDEYLSAVVHVLSR